VLVLSRKLGEKIWIGPDVCVVVVAIDRGVIRLGFDAPRDVQVMREELLADTDPRSPHYRRPLTGEAG